MIAGLGAPRARSSAALALCAAMFADLGPAVAQGTATSTESESAWTLLARGSAALSAGEFAASVRWLERAALLAPASTSVLRELAAAYLASGDPVRALALADRATELGETEPELVEVAARALMALGRDDDARRRVDGFQDPDLELIAASLGDAASASATARWLDEPTERGALTALMLAQAAAAKGQRAGARNLGLLAEELARRAGDEPVLERARALGARLLDGDLDVFRIGGRVRADLLAVSNPEYRATSRSLEPGSFQGGLMGEVAMQAPLGATRLDLAVGIEQLLALSDRAEFAGQDLTGLGAAAALEVPLGARPDGATVQVAIRFSDLFGDAFRVHYATAFEVGGTLGVPVGPRTRAGIGVVGVGVDFIDRSPPGARVSSQNRDRIGQRAVATLDHDLDLGHVRVEAAFLRDDAYGEAFDARGGLVGAHAVLKPRPGVELLGGLSLSALSYGPVGDALVIGDAATRTEARLAVRLGARVALSSALALQLQDVFVETFGRAEHEYRQNLLALSVEAAW